MNHLVLLNYPWIVNINIILKRHFDELSANFSMDTNANNIYDGGHFIQNINERCDSFVKIHS